MSPRRRKALARQVYIAGKAKLLSLGGWPHVGLAAAREERDNARKALATGADPAREKQLKKHRDRASAANSFGEIA